MFLPTSSLFSSSVGLCRWWNNSLSVALLPSVKSHCLHLNLKWQWPSFYLSEEIIPEIWKPWETWGGFTKQGRGGLANCIASLTGLVNGTKCYLQLCPMSTSHEDMCGKMCGAFLWDGKVSIFYHAIGKYRSVSINISNYHLLRSLFQVQIPLTFLWHWGVFLGRARLSYRVKMSRWRRVWVLDLKGTNLLSDFLCYIKHSL